VPFKEIPPNFTKDAMFSNDLAAMEGLNSGKILWRELYLK
jgi:hypothetical protein